MSYLDEQVEKIKKEQKLGRSGHTLIKLPCNHASVEITRTGDQWVQCPECSKSFMLTWSNNPKITSND